MAIFREADYNDTISFNVYPTSILGTSFDNVKLVGIVPAALAESLGMNPYVLHQQVYPLLPSGVAANDANSYQYLLIEAADGTRRAIGAPWIDLSTFQVRNRRTAILRLIDMDSDKLQIVREALSANSIQIESVELV